MSANDEFDALGWATIISICVVGVLAVADVFATGGLEAGVLALLAATVGPLIPALIARSRRKK